MYNEGRFPDDGDVFMPEWTADGHLEEGTIHAWLDREYNAANSEVIDAHIHACVACQQSVAEARGLLAGASRITAMLDAVPSGVLPSRSEPASVPSASAQLAAIKKVATGAGSGAGGLSHPWFGQRFMRFAAAILVFVGGAAVWSNLPSPSVAEFADSAQKVSAPEASALSNRSNAVGSTMARPTTPPVTPPAAPRRTPSVASASIPPIQLAEKSSAKSVPDVANALAERREMVAASPPPSVSADRMRAPSSAAMGVGSSVQSTSETVIRGRVVDELGAGLSAATVSERASATMVATDSSGRFTLRTRLESIDLVTRRIGFTSAQTRVVLDGRDSVTVDIPLTKSVQSLSAVVVTGDVPPLVERTRLSANAITSASRSAHICLAYQPVGVSDKIAGMNVRESRSESARDDAAANSAMPRFILVERTVDLSATPLQTSLATWSGALNTSLPVTVAMSFDTSGVMRGVQLGGRQQLQLAIRQDSNAWTGIATFVNGLSQSRVPVRYVVVAPDQCNF